MITLEEFVETCQKNGLTNCLNASGLVDFSFGKAVVCRYMAEGHFASGSKAKVFVWPTAKRVWNTKAICFYDMKKPRTVLSLQKYIDKAIAGYKEEVKKVRKQMIEEL